MGHEHCVKKCLHWPHHRHERHLKQSKLQNKNYISCQNEHFALNYSQQYVWSFTAVSQWNFNHLFSFVCIFPPITKEQKKKTSVNYVTSASCDVAAALSLQTKSGFIYRKSCVERSVCADSTLQPHTDVTVISHTHTGNLGVCLCPRCPREDGKTLINPAEWRRSADDHFFSGLFPV